MPGSDRSGRHRPSSPVPPWGQHHHGFNEAIRDLLTHNRAGLAPDTEENFVTLTFIMQVQERQNPGWVVEYIVDPAP